jgi:hypothetical protein
LTREKAEFNAAALSETVKTKKERILFGSRRRLVAKSLPVGLLSFSGASDVPESVLKRHPAVVPYTIYQIELEGCP